MGCSYTRERKNKNAEKASNTNESSNKNIKTLPKNDEKEKIEGEAPNNNNPKKKEINLMAVMLRLPQKKIILILI